MTLQAGRFGLPGFVVLRHPQHLTFVCDDCKPGGLGHEGCRGGTWCDCQHRAPRS